MDIYSIKGKVLEFGAVAGTSEMSLDDAVRKYASEGKYKISFLKSEMTGKMLVISNSGMALPEAFRGTFEQPALGWLAVVDRKVEENYSMTGESYGQGIVPVILDFAEILGLKAVDIDDPLYTQGLAQMTPYLMRNDKMLSACKDEKERREVYLGMIRNPKEFAKGAMQRPDPKKFPPSMN
jgi:hypothetical protein